MFISVTARHSEHAQRDTDRYAAWRAGVQQLRDDWADGIRPQASELRQYLQAVPEQHRAEALQDLVAEQMRLAWQAGRGPRLDIYVMEFSQESAQLVSLEVVPADLVEDEFLARFQFPHGDAPLLEEYAQRFPKRCDVMELLQERTFGGGRYVKLNKIGQGAMGEVWEAFDRQLRRLVAIKQPRAAFAGNLEMLQRFAEEARTTARLEHPSIVSVHEHHQHDHAVPFYVMRLVSGRTLGQCIRDFHQPANDRAGGQQRLLWHQLLQSFGAICDAVAYAHERGVLHRDLKPGNIVVGAFGETAILDWGMAGEKETSPNVVVGTPDYMPPEQADGMADARSDVFGLGAILYEILTSRPPHTWADSSRPADWRGIVRQAQFYSPRQLNPDASRALEAICLKALARDPADRYPSAVEMAQEVRRYLAREPVAAWTEPFWIRLWRWCGRA